LQAAQPLLVVSRGEVFGRRDPLARVAPHVDVPLAMVAAGEIESVHARLPLGVDHRLVLLDFDRTHAVHAAHVLDAVHGLLRSGALTCATPIIASRVTIAASSSSLQPSVPAGRSGSTR